MKGMSQKSIRSHRQCKSSESGHKMQIQNTTEQNEMK